MGMNSPTSFSRNPIAGFLEGFVLPMRGLRLLLNTPGLKRVAVLPVLVNMLLWSLCFFGLFWLLWNWDIPDVSWTFFDPVGPWLASAVNTLGEAGKWLLFPVALVVSWFTFTTVGFVVASPFNDILSARLEAALCRPVEQRKTSVLVTTQQTMTSLLDSARLAGRQGSWTLLCLPLLFVPLLGSLPLFVVTAHFTGLSFLDAAMARNNLRDRHKHLGWDRLRWQLLGLGVAMELLFLIPFLGMVVMPAGVCAGTWLYCHLDWKDLMTQSGGSIPPGFIPPDPAVSVEPS